MAVLSVIGWRSLFCLWLISFSLCLAQEEDNDASETGGSSGDSGSSADQSDDGEESSSSSDSTGTGESSGGDATGAADDDSTSNTGDADTGDDGSSSSEDGASAGEDGSGSSDDGETTGEGTEDTDSSEEEPTVVNTQGFNMNDNTGGGLNLGFTFEEMSDGSVRVHCQVSSEREDLFDQDSEDDLPTLYLVRGRTSCQSLGPDDTVDMQRVLILNNASKCSSER